MAEPPTLIQDTSVRKRAISRLVIAVVLIGAAIIGLTLVDKLTVVDRPKPRPLPSIAVAPPAPPAVESAPPPPEATTPDAAAPEAPPPPEVSRVPDAHVEGKPPAPPLPAAPAPGQSQAAGTTNQGPAGVVPRSAVTPPATQGAGAAAPGPGVTGASKAPTPVTGAANQGAAPTGVGPGASRPSAAAAPSTPLLKLEEAPVAPEKGYTVQMGVFNTYANADALLAKLKDRGVPAYAETRVLVGPFRSRQDARKAAQALKDIGAGPILSPAAR